MEEKLALKKSLPSVSCFIKKGKHLEPKFLKTGMEITTTLTENLKGRNT